MTLLTPLAALVVLVVALPLSAVALGVRRAAAVRKVLRLRAPRHGTDVVVLAALVASFVLLAIAATQPALAHDTVQRVRTDAQVLFVLDTSRSMAAALSPSTPTRLARAETAAATLRASIPGVEAGVGTLTDRVLPDLLPVADRPSFDATLARAVGIEQPPPRFVSVTATTFGALAAIPSSGFFESTAKRRVVVLLTDGESRPFDPGALGRALSGVGLVVVGVRRDGEAVFLPSGRPEPGYRSDPSAPAALATLAAATNGRAFGEAGLRAASTKLRQLLGTGPTASVISRSRRETPLAPYVALAALIPLAFLVRRRTAGSKRRTFLPAMMRGLRSSTVLGPLVIVLLLGGALTSASAGTKASGPNVGWGGFGNTPNELRHSGLTLITKDNVAGLGRVVTVDFHAIDAGVRRGEQSFPVVANGTMYVTTNDDNVWALDATTGKVKWRYQPDNGGVFKNFGIVANRGVALCDGKIFVLTLDMTIVSLDPATGNLIKRVGIAQAVPGASSNYGYSETSAPICANHHLVIGAAGSEYGVRGFVMAYHTDLTPAWPNPFWTIPPEGTSWRRFARLAGGGVVWTPTSIDTSTNTLYFGTGSATPLYYPAFRPGPNPRTDSLIAVDLNTGKMKWWQQQMAFNEWSYDTAQPPLVYDAKVGGKKRHIVSVGTMEGVWFAYDAKTGQPIYQRVKVIDRTEHPPLQPGKPVSVFPSSLGGLNYSPASYDPGTNYILNGAAETASVMTQTKLSPTEKKRKRLLGDIFLGLQNGDFGSILPGWHDHGSISAIDVNTGKQVWKFNTPEPERGGVSTTDSGLGFAGGGDGVLRAFDLTNGKVLWTFQTGHQIAAGPAIYSVDGKQYIAVTSGGTPTSSSGGISSELQIFALGGSKTESKPPLRTLANVTAPVVQAMPKAVAAPVARVASRATGLGRMSTQSGLVVQPWQASSNNTLGAVGHLFYGSRPVAGAVVRVGGYTIPQATGKDGSFVYPVDITVARRSAATVLDASHATIGGQALTAAQQSALLGTQAGFNVGYAIDGLKVRRQSNGTVLVTGRVHDSAGAAPPPVVLFTYQLSGIVTDPTGKPVQGAIVVTRTADRDFWTFSSPSDAQGHYTSFFSAADELGADPVPLNMQVAVGPVSYGGAQGTTFNFKRLHSSSVNLQLPKTPPTALPVTTPTSYTGAVYVGLVLGVTVGGNVVKPVAETWPDAHGAFSMVLPSSVRGKTLHFWENRRQFFSRFAAAPGKAVDLASWPTGLGDAVPTGLASLDVP